MNYRDIFEIDVTLVANDFLDNYMPKANGEYVKVYLYLLKHKAEKISVSEIAEKLELTEGDVNRAVNYWREQGILVDRPDGADSGVKEIKKEIPGTRPSPEKKPEAQSRRRPEATGEQKERLTGDDEFRQLLMIAQKYMSRIFTPREVDVFIYLYDNLKLPADVLDYLVDYCVQGGHNDIRYIEKTGLNWAAQGIRDVASAMKQTKAFDKVKEEAMRKSEIKSVKAGRKKTANRTDTDYDALVMEQAFLRKIE